MNASAFAMIDVGDKPETRRVAVASGRIRLGAIAYPLVRDRALPKGDALLLAEIAGINGAKGTAQLLPLCHPLPLEQVKVVCTPEDTLQAVIVTATVRTTARTGVEMEALAAVQAALLCIWDLAKQVEPDLCIEEVRLLVKMGGKSGTWLSPAGVPDAVTAAVLPPAPPPVLAPVLAGRRAVVMTVSDRAAAGTYPDLSGPKLAAILAEAGASVVETRLVPDDLAAIRAAAVDLLDRVAPDLLVTTGGTGVAPRDVTPEALIPLFERAVPGIPELLRLDGTRHTPLSWASRAVAGIRGRSLIITLPGNPGAVAEGMEALLPRLLPHLLKLLTPAD